MNLLRSKSFDANSYNSGDWSNRLDLSHQTNNWGVGLPPAFAGNSGNWTVMQPLLANPALNPAPTDIAQAHAVFLDWIKLRRSSPLLRLPSGAEVKSRIRFANVGPDQVPGLVVMTIDDASGHQLDPHARSLVAIINVAPTARSFAMPGYANRHLVLHPVQATGADPVVKTSAYALASGTVTVPARTAAVFIETR